MTNEEKKDMIGEIIDQVEGFLEFYEINIPNDEREGHPEALNIYGSDYETMSYQIGEVLTKYGVVGEESEEEDPGLTTLRREVMPEIQSLAQKVFSDYDMGKIDMEDFFEDVVQELYEMQDADSEDLPDADDIASAFQHQLIIRITTDVE